MQPRQRSLRPWWDGISRGGAYARWVLVFSACDGAQPAPHVNTSFDASVNGNDASVLAVDASSSQVADESSSLDGGSNHAGWSSQTSGARDSAVQTPPSASSRTSMTTSDGELDASAARAECKITRRLEIPDQHRNTEVRTMADGFALLPNGFTPSPIPWSVGNFENRWSSSNTVTAIDYDGRLVPTAVAGTVADPRLVLAQRVATMVTESGTLWQAQSYKPDGTPAGPLVDVLNIFHRGTALSVSATSFDGERVLLGNAHSAAWDPRVILLTKDADLMSDELRLFDTNDSPALSCFEAFGTEHGALALAVDDASKTLHLTEFASDGTVVAQPSWQLPEPLTSEGYHLCPQASVEATGTYLTFQSGNAPVLPTIAVYRLESTDIELVAVIRSPGQAHLTWAQSGRHPLVQQQQGDLMSFARFVDGNLVQLPGEFVASDTFLRFGHIYLLEGSLSEGTVAISEVECGEFVGE